MPARCTLYLVVQYLTEVVKFCTQKYQVLGSTWVRTRRATAEQTFASRLKWDVKEWGLDIRGLNADMSLLAFLRVSDPFAWLLSRSSNRAYG